MRRYHIINYSDTRMISVCSETKNNMETIRNKWYKIVGNTPKKLTNMLIIRKFE